MKKLLSICFALLFVLCLTEGEFVFKKPVESKPLPAYAEEIVEDLVQTEEKNEFVSEGTTSIDPVEYYSDQIKLCVVGDATKMLAPDSGVVHAQITGFGQDCQESKTATFDKFDKVVETLTQNGCDKSKIIIDSFYSRPCRDCHMSGCHGRLSFSFKIDDLKKADEIMSAILDNGVEEISSVCYEVSNIEEEYSNLLNVALENAKSKASKLLGDNLQLVDIKEESVYYSNCLYKDYVENGTNWAGEIEVRAKVVATFI